jgi:valyl-tRNA synthetase
MMMAGQELTGGMPFSDVIVHSIVLAPDGRRMSKSLGTGIDPLEAVEKHGADATRYGLLKISSSQDVRFSCDRIEEGQKLANKLWNVARLILQNREEIAPDLRPETLEETWIVRRIEDTRAEIEELLPAFQFAAVVDSLYHLTFDDFCDWYAEAIKPRLYDRDERAISTALASLERLLALLHPVMPHVTEEIWSQFHASRLIVSPWPEPAGTEGDGKALDRVQEAAAIFRRSGVPVPLEGEEKRIFDAVVKPERAKANGDADAERARLQKEIARAEKMLANEKFVQGAKPEVVDAERKKLERYRRELEAIGG